MASFNQEIIEEIRNRCDIADVIGTYVQLKQRGPNSFTGLCPFHQEKTPSFHVNRQWQRYHCFGCGKGGDVFKFIMEHDNIGFPDAIQQLAQRCGVILPERSDYDAGAARIHRDQKERLLKVNEEFSDLFVRFLRDNPRSPAGIYLDRRGITREVADKFRIGALPEDRYFCLNYGRHLGFTEEDLIAAGICGRAEESGRVYERFTGRLTFAIQNEYGRGVGFSARSLEAKPADGRKYVNTPETLVFKKGMLLYALHQARENISKERKVILCEGQMDTIAMHRAGFTNAVAPLGTAFTPEQAKLLKRYADTVYLAFDSDGAGQKAFLRALEYLLPLSVSVNMIPIPGGKDPDELYNNGGAGAVAEAVNGALPWLTRFSQMLPGLYDMSTPVGRAQAAAFMVSLFDLVRNPIERETYIREGAALLQVSEEALYGELRTLKNRRERGKEFRRPDGDQQPAAPPPAPVPATPERSALLALFSLAVTSSDNAREISDLLPPEALDGKDVLSRGLNLLLGGAISGEPENETSAALNGLLSENSDPEMEKLLLEPLKFDDPVKALADSVREVVRLSQRRRYTEIMQAMRSCTDPVRREELMKQLKEVLERK